MKKILLTGASGFIGYNILQNLVRLNFLVFAVGKKKPNFFHKNFKFIKYDLQNKLLIKEKIKFDSVVHTSAISPDNNISNKKIMNFNIKTTKNIVDYAYSNNIKNFIFLSSVSVFGDIKVKIINENTKKNKQTIYGKSKFMNEQYISLKKIPAISIRLPGVIGKNSKRNLLTRIVNSKEKKIVAYNKDEIFNNLIHVQNLSEFVISLCKKKLKKRNLPVVVASKNPIPFKDVLKMLVKKKIIFKDSKKISFTIDYRRAAKKLNFRPWSTTFSLKKFKKESEKRKKH